MVDFSKLKAQSGLKGLETLSTTVAKINNKSNNVDDRFWQPTVDKAGNGYAVIRFLPAPPDEDVPFIREFDHGFQGPGGWYIEKSLSTIGLPDPVLEFNGKLWNSSQDDKGPERTQVREQKRRLHYISNIYVITDSGNPENEGKAFLYKYGKKIFDKLNEAMNPPEVFGKLSATPFNPFDLWAGANFELKVRRVEKQRNFDKSEFEKCSPLFDDDAKLEALWKKEYSLQEFLDPKNFKTYDELKARLDKVLDLRGKAASTVRKAEDEDLPWTREEKSPSFKESAAPEVDSDDDELMKHFRSLAQ
jgi:hypothetical protein